MNTKISTLAAIGLAGLFLSACESTTPPPPPPAAAAQAQLRTAPPADELTCLKALATETGNTVELLSSTTSATNNTVIIGVGPQKARWQCLVNKGKVVQVMSLTDEGAA